MPPPSIPSDPVARLADINEACVLRALKSFPGGSAPGPSNLRGSHLREAVTCPSPDRAAQALSALSNEVKLLCAGHAPLLVIPHLCRASFLPCKKKSGGLCPIAEGEISTFSLLSSWVWGSMPVVTRWHVSLKTRISLLDPNS